MRVNIKYVVASVVLLLGSVAGMTAAYAAPRNADCVNCSPRSRYDSDEVIQKIRNSRGSADAEPVASDRDSGPRMEPAYRETPRTEPSYRDSTPAQRTEPVTRTEECPGCPPARKYDSQEVVKSSHDIDKSDVINTTTVVPVTPRYREQNHLIVHENETRLVGTVQHNNMIVEKEIRYVRRAPVYYQRPHYHHYRPVVQTQYVYVPIIQRSSGCGCNTPPPPPVQSCGNCGVQVGYAGGSGYAATPGYYYGY